MGRVQDCVARQFSSLWPLSICKGHETGVAGQLTGGLSVIPNTYGEGTTMTEISLWVDILQDEDSLPKPAHSHQVISVIQHFDSKGLPRCTVGCYQHIEVVNSSSWLHFISLGSDF